MCNHCIYTSTGRAYRLDQVSRGKPAPYQRHAFDVFAPALFGLFAGLALVAYVAQVVT